MMTFIMFRPQYEIERRVQLLLCSDEFDLACLEDQSFTSIDTPRDRMEALPLSFDRVFNRLLQSRYPTNKELGMIRQVTR